MNTATPLHITLRQLKAAVAVAKAKSFTRAAKLLHVSQPALTVQIRQLEDALQIKLFDRNKRMVEPTSAGRELVATVERVIHELEAAIDHTIDLSSKKRGAVTVATLPSVAATILPGVIARYRQHYPAVNVRIQDAVAAKVLSSVKAAETDFGIGTMTRPEPELVFTPLMQDDITVFFAAGHPLHHHKSPVSLRSLTGYPTVLMTTDTSVRQLVDQAFYAIGHTISPACEASYMSTAIAMVKAGLGITLLPSSAMELEGIGGLKTKVVNYEGFRRQIGVIQRVGRSLSPAAESFLETLRSSVPKQRALQRTSPI